MVLNIGVLLLHLNKKHRLKLTVTPILIGDKKIAHKLANGVFYKPQGLNYTSH